LQRWEANRLLNGTSISVRKKAKVFAAGVALTIASGTDTREPRAVDQYGSKKIARLTLTLRKKNKKNNTTV